MDARRRNGGHSTRYAARIGRAHGNPSSSPAAGPMYLGVTRTAQLFAPAVALMGRLRFAQKFALIALVFLAALAFTGRAYLRSQDGQIAFSAKERVGLRVVAPTGTLLGRLAALRTTAVRAASGDAAAADALPAREAAVTEAEGAVDRAVQADGEELGVTKRWSELKRAIAAAPQAGDTPAAALEGLRRADRRGRRADRRGRQQLEPDPRSRPRLLLRDGRRHHEGPGDADRAGGDVRPPRPRGRRRARSSGSTWPSPTARSRPPPTRAAPGWAPHTRRPPTSSSRRISRGVDGAAGGVGRQGRRRARGRRPRRRRRPRPAAPTPRSPTPPSCRRRSRPRWTGCSSRAWTACAARSAP